MDRDRAGRPSVLERATETQIEELERQYAEGDRDYWKQLTHSYGWSDQESDEVWDWFGQRATGGAQSMGGPGVIPPEGQQPQGGGELF
jgi:hypothetical protein